jgi:hypothetical protein
VWGPRRALQAYIDDPMKTVIIARSSFDRQIIEALKNGLRPESRTLKETYDHCENNGAKPWELPFNLHKVQGGRISKSNLNKR